MQIVILLFSISAHKRLAFSKDGQMIFFDIRHTQYRPVNTQPGISHIAVAAFSDTASHVSLKRQKYVFFVDEKLF